MLYVVVLFPLFVAQCVYCVVCACMWRVLCDVCCVVRVVGFALSVFDGSYPYVLRVVACLIFDYVSRVVFWLCCVALGISCLFVVAIVVVVVIVLSCCGMYCTAVCCVLRGVFFVWFRECCVFVYVFILVCCRC